MHHASASYLYEADAHHTFETPDADSNGVKAMSWAEEEIVWVSSIEHYSYCARQCALIHIEHIFEDNIYTLEGKNAHDNIDVPANTELEGVHIETALPIWSERLGLVGKTDLVEFHPDGMVYPVEYKHGPRRKNIHADMQLCAQAMCLEEMLGLSIAKGAVFHCASKRRREVLFTEELRRNTEEIIEQIREMLIRGDVPIPANDARCSNCSLVDECIPSAFQTFHSPSTKSRLFTPLPEE